MRRTRPLARAALAVVVAASLWLPNAHRAVAPRGPLRPATTTGALAESLLDAQLRAWSARAHDGDIARLRAGCEEWDFMRRTFLVLSLANVALREPARAPALLPVMDSLIDDTLAQERAHGQRVFLMGYASRRPWVQQPARSVFIDGEVALMIGARRMVRDDGRYDREHAARVREITARLTDAPLHSAESYPDECWTFCNTIALVALRLYDRRTGEDHRPLVARWLGDARAHLIDPRTGLLASSFTMSGRIGDGPEGSSIFLAAHMLQLLDPGLARDQYQRARNSLGRSVLGFGWAREWPGAVPARDDVDSGPTVPWLGANAGASGLALVGAAAFGDDAWLRALVASVHLAAFPVREGSGVRLAAGNAVGDAVMLYALTLGPLWQAAGVSS
jgi:hypothetical protein